MAKTIRNSRMRLEMARKEAADASSTWVILRKLCSKQRSQRDAQLAAMTCLYILDKVRYDASR